MLMRISQGEIELMQPRDPKK